MNELYILTQNFTIVSLNGLREINLYGGVVEVEKNDGKKANEEIDMIEVSAQFDSTGADSENDNGSVSLGLYFTEEEAASVMSSLADWLNEKNDYGRVFRMPQTDLKDDSYSEEGAALDYSVTDSSEPI